jgi:hypothetical protein
LWDPYCPPVEEERRVGERRRIDRYRHVEKQRALQSGVWRVSATKEQ